MANQRISAFDEVTTPAPDDLFAMVDVSPETDVTVKVQHMNIFKLTAGLDALADHGSHGPTLTGRNYGETVAIGQLVYLDSTAHEFMLADADAAGKWPARGIAVNSGGDGDAAIVLVLGVVRDDSWAFTEGATLYLSDTPGVVSGTAPTGSGDCIQVVGFALSDDEAFFNFTGNYSEHD